MSLFRFICRLRAGGSGGQVGGQQNHKGGEGEENQVAGEHGETSCNEVKSGRFGKRAPRSRNLSSRRTVLRHTTAFQVGTVRPIIRSDYEDFAKSNSTGRCGRVSLRPADP